MIEIKKQLIKLRELKRKIFFYIFRYPKYRFLPTPLFEHINIQTNNRCTRRCRFCYYGISRELSPIISMQRDLFEKIIDELVELNFSGRISLYEINESLTDPRIFDFLSKAKRKLPHAFHFLITNGDLLDKEKGEKLFKAGLDELWVNCYEEDDLSRNKGIVDYFESNGHKTKLIRNYKAEEWDSRAGNVGNYYKGKVRAPCELVYKQVIVKPDGKVSICVNDFFDKSLIGDINKQTLKEVWFGQPYEKLRRSLVKKDRSVNELCSLCDYKGYDGFVNKIK